MPRNQFYIYQCKDKNLKSERIIKLPSFWAYETIAVALASFEFDVKGVYIKNDGMGYYSDCNNKIYGGLSFAELEDTNITIELIFRDGNKKIFECKKIGIDIAKSNITKKLPVVVSCNDVKEPEKAMRLYTIYYDYFFN